MRLHGESILNWGVVKEFLEKKGALCKCLDKYTFKIRKKRKMKVSFFKDIVT